jgi:DNA replication protein
MASVPRFPDRMESIPIPAPFFGPLLEELQDPAELRCALRVIGLAQRVRSGPKLVTLGQLRADRVLLRSLRNDPEGSQRALERALVGLVEKGVLLNFWVDGNGSRKRAFMLDTSQGRQVAGWVAQGESVKLGQSSPSSSQLDILDRSIFQLYEETVGVITPLLAEDLKDAEATYPAEWVIDAFRQAAVQNKRRWSYVAAILRRWQEEGRTDGESERHPEKVEFGTFLRERRRH